MSPVVNGQLRELMPHALGMCLLDEVEAWDDLRIRCTARSHRDPRNPLRSGDRLGALQLCEYGAQAMAAHGGLLARRDRAAPSASAGDSNSFSMTPAGARAAPGMLVALRDVEFAVDRVDDLEGVLTVFAHLKVADATGCLYRFEVSIGSRWLARGRVSVIFSSPSTRSWPSQFAGRH